MMIKKGLLETSDNSEVDEGQEEESNKKIRSNSAKKKKKKGKSDSQTVGMSLDTTVYKNLLKEVSQTDKPKEIQVNTDIDVDSEITFRIKNNMIADCEQPEVERRESMSSEEKIDTSDELIEVDCECFIAECREEARSQQKKNKSQEGEQGDKPREFPGDRLIREAESARARMYTILGNNNL